MSVLFANAGTPFIWLQTFHLLFGNILLGMLEASLITGAFWTIRNHVPGMMVLANYVSAGLGMALLVRFDGIFPDTDITNERSHFWILMIVAYVLTLIVEWPFVYWCLKGEENRFAKSILASFYVQSVTYVLMTGLYALVSGGGSNLTVVPASEMTFPEKLHVYYISADDGHVYRRMLGGGNAELVKELQEPGDWLSVEGYFRDSPCPTGRLHAHSKRGSDVVLEKVDLSEYLDFSELPRIPNWYGYVTRMNSSSTKGWRFYNNFWPGKSFQGSNQATGDEVYYGPATIFGSLETMYATQLASDQVILQVGRNQICAVDPATKRIALLWRGRGPVVLSSK